MLVSLICVLVVGYSFNNIKCELALPDYNFDEGSGDYNINRWFIDRKNVSCKRFQFKGYSSTFNNFPTKKACDRHLIYTPEEQLQACKLGKDEGKCEGKFEKWYYNNEKSECESLAYTGCGGNGNVFDDKDECELACKHEYPHKSLPNKFDCKLKPFVDDLDIKTGIIADLENHRCIYGAVGGLERRGIFKDFGSCVDICIPTDKKIPACRSQPYQGEGCEAILKKNPYEPLLRFYYDTEKKRCLPFESCSGDLDLKKNSFKSFDLCQSYCGGADITTTESNTNICSLSVKEGKGNLTLTRYYFNGEKCHKFTYGGIDGNGNNFESEELCNFLCRD